MVDTVQNIGRMSYFNLTSHVCKNKYNMKSSKIETLLRNTFIAESFINMNSIHNALRVYQRLFSIFPFIDVLLYNIGVAYYQLNDIDNAILNYHNALKLNPKCFMANYNLAYCYFEKTNYDKALFYYQMASNSTIKYINVTPMIKLLKNCRQNDQLISYYNIGKIHLNWKQYKQFIYAYELGIMLHKDDDNLLYATMCYDIGSYMYSIDNLNDALKYWQFSLNINIDINELNQNSYINCIHIYTILKNHTIGLELCKQYFKKYKSDDKVLYCYTILLFLNNDFVSTISIIKNFIDNNDSIDIQLLLLISYIKLGQFSNASNTTKFLENKQHNMTDIQLNLYLQTISIFEN